MSDHVFNPGDTATFVRCPGHRSNLRNVGRYFGTDVRVESHLMPYSDLMNGEGYLVAFCDGRQAWVVPWCLEKKPKAPAPSALDSDETPNAPAKFDPVIWAPTTEVLA